MTWNDRHSRPYPEFRQMVRRYRPSELIPALAGYSATAALKRLGEERPRDPRSDTPWAISAAARDSILYGNEHRDGQVRDETVGELVWAFNNTGGEVGGLSLGEMITPVTHEQFPYQESEFEEMSRVYALFEDPTLGSSLDWTDVFGMPLRDAVRASLVLSTWTNKGGGRFDPDILDQANMQEVFHRVAPREQIETLARALTTTIDEAKATNATVPALPQYLQRYAFNPLTARPLVDLGEHGIWSPQTMLIDRALFPANLYYRGIAHWGKRFSKDLGERTEAYVGKQLSLIAGSDLYGEIEYHEGKDLKKSVDWIWVTPRAVILVECKSARLTLGARAGDASLPELTDRYLTYARKQLDRTAALIQTRTPPFDKFPVDRPLVGIAVTSEPFYLGNSTLEEYGTHSTIPSMVASLRDLEYWVCLPAAEAVDKLLAVLDDPERRTWAFHQALGNLRDLGRNPILDAAWREYDFIEHRNARNQATPSSDRRDATSGVAVT
ncbi:hypothetical protein [Prescottella agglutinans]|uniref:Uncharacterized protein n=1 Tax=Prescottella agglutinans TaxID=1644129 RepID=A0ABT6MI55_9NOCA|nr:hypothetical protein [Prescottella agglutinans]MDH6283972.1 hypothetical protein [Prescottella agglutinans]